MPIESIEHVYTGHNNSIDLLLTTDGTPLADTSVITKITATFAGLLIESGDSSTPPILWDQPGFLPGEFRCYFGDSGIPAGEYEAPFVVYDPAHPDGIMWGRVFIIVHAEVEGVP